MKVNASGVADIETHRGKSFDAELMGVGIAFFTLCHRSLHHLGRTSARHTDLVVSNHYILDDSVLDAGNERTLAEVPAS